MKNAIAALQNVLFVADDEKGLEEREYTTDSERIVKLENYIEILWKSLVEKKRELSSLQEDVVMLPKARKAVWIIGIVLLVLFPILEFLSYGDAVIHTIFGPASVAMSGAIGIDAMITIALTIAVTLISKLIKKEKIQVDGLEAEIEYLETTLNKSNEELAEIKSKEATHHAYTEEVKKEDLSDYNKGLINSLKARLDLMNSLGSLRERLLEAYENGSLEKFLEEKGWATEEIEIGRQFAITQKEKEQAA